MNADELKAALQLFYDNYDEIGVSVYAILKNPDNPGPQKLDIEAVWRGNKKVDTFLRAG